MVGNDGTGSGDSRDDDREWNDPSGVEVYDDEPDADDESKGALNVATEGESFVGDGDGGREPITPGDVSLESALFVALGAALTVFTAVQFII